jgi:hypothetical protein
MIQRLKAVYRDGVFVPEEPFDLPNETHVDLTIADLPPSPAERVAGLRALVERMQSNPVPANAPRFTRDQLHERR